VRLIARTYWAGMPFEFRTPPRAARVESLRLCADDGRQLGGLYWTPEASPRPRVAVLCMHPRVDFGRHYSFPRLLEAGIGCLGATTRNPNNDTTTVHEEIVLDVAACVRFLREERGARRVVLLGNSGGGSLLGFFQAQAARVPEGRLTTTPAGRPTALARARLDPADGLVLVSAHRGEGHVMNACIDPAVVDEERPDLSDPSLDMYDPRNGFRPPPEWSRYAPEFVARYRAAQRERVARIDARALALVEEQGRAAALHAGPGFQDLSAERQREILRREAFQPVMLVYRTMANLHYVDRTLDPSNREYGSLLSDRPDLMNWQLLGFGRMTTPDAWLSTWSGLSSNADLVRNGPEITVPVLMANAGRDREIYPQSDARPIFEALGAADKRCVEFPDARHYFEPDFGEQEAPEVERLMDVVVPWIQERFEA
jgi:alpha-beta hydrolase superfamily lysophospholipase